MKIKGIDRTANIAWSPENHYPVYLAAGTADQPFSTTAALEVYELNLSDPGHDMNLVASSQSEHRFHKLKWGTHGQASGTIVGGCDGGVIEIYNTSKFLSGEKGLVAEHSKHKGPVKALDFNSFQSNLLASGASESEIYIWDLNNPTTAMTPGSKSQPLEDITYVAWNKQVQHILASSFSSKCVVWDLRKNDPIIKLTDSTVRIRWSVVAWNPDIATQLCLGSEADQNPVVQLWDLRFATSPLKVLENHKQGVLSVSWCQQDTDMLLSCGRDNKIICWNPNSSLPGTEVICEIASSDQYNFDVSWCPKNPALFACSSFDGHVSIYSLVGGPQQVQTSNKIADSFPGMELYTQAPVPQSHSAHVEMKKAPKWLKRPIRTSFGFGGKLVSIENMSNPGGETSPSRMVYISQVITEPDLVSRSAELEAALHGGHYADFCRSKIEKSGTGNDKHLWEFIAANFEPSPRTQFLNLLGFHSDNMTEKLSRVMGQNSSLNDEVRQINNRMASLGRSTDSDSEVEGCDEISNHRCSVASGDGVDFNSSDFDAALSSGNELKDFKISAGDDPDGLICQAILMGNTEAAVELCLQNNRMADAIILAMTGGSELLAKTQFRYFQQNNGYISSLISAVVTEDWSHVIQNCDVGSWKEALAAVISYNNDQELSLMCEKLGERLENERSGALSKNALLCYICAGNLGRFVSSWLKSNTSSPEDLQELVELVMILKKSMEIQGTRTEISGRLADLLSQYAAILASQGSLEAALSYLGNSNDPQIAELRERLNYSVGRTPVSSQSQPKHPSSHLRSQRSSISSGFYPPQKKPEDILTNPPVPLPGFNLNPLQSGPGATHSYQPSPYPPSAPAPVPQTVPPPLPRAYPSPSPGPASGVTSRSKHVLDPSVQSTTPRPMSTPHFYPQNQFQTTPYPQPVQSNNFNLNPTAYQTDAFNSVANTVMPQPPRPKPSATPQAPGWNDPPVVDSSRNLLLHSDYYHHPKEEYRNMSAEHAGTRKWKSVISHSHSQQPKQEFVQPTPITHPLMGGLASDSAVNGQPGDYYQGSQNQYQYQSFAGRQQYPYQQYQAGNMPNQSYQDYQQPDQVPMAVPASEEPMKKPIPEEHLVLQTVFDDLRSKCLLAASNPQSKKKLDDVSKKLDVLYDNLRSGKLSSNTLQGLHLMVQHVKAGNYPNGLMLHTQLVSGPDFSQIASFMPGLKVLLQSALQMEVYL